MLDVKVELNGRWARVLGALVVVLVACAPPLWAQETPQTPASSGEQPSTGRRAAREQQTAEAPRDPRIDSKTGEDKRVWPPDALFAHKHFKLEMLVPDMSKHEFSATATITLEPIGNPRERVVLDAGPGLTFSAVRVNGRPAAAFEHAKDKQKLTVEFGRSYKPGEQIVVAMDYTAVKPGGRGAGLTWSKDDPRTPEVDIMMHAQGEAQSNHLWFPCHDFPNLRVPTEMIVTLPEPYEAVSNGRLVSVTRKSYASLGLTPPAPQKPATEGSEDEPAEPSPTHLRTFHWEQDLPHSYYLQTLIMSRFDVVNIGGPQSAFPGLWMPVYGPLGSGEALRKSFGNTPAMIEYFSKLFGYRYPWDKYAQVICRDFAAGAMENTGVVTFASGMGRGGRRGSIDSIISHELTHHWFGDLATCKSWEHIWLNEGWATMGEALWAEHERGEDGYQAAMLRNFETERARSYGRTAPLRAPMVSNLYRTPDSKFTGADNCYSKGGAILHMLRMRLGDEAFFGGVHSYLEKHAFGQVETDDFRVMLEASSGQSLERFFDQWCKRPGLPSLEVDLEWKAAESGDGGTLEVVVDQGQKIDADNPAYAVEVPMWVSFSDKDDDGRWVSVVTDTRHATRSVKLAKKPKDVEVDPDLTVLCRKKIRQPLEQALNRLRSGRATLAAKMDAVELLSESADPRASAMLARVALPRSVWFESAFDDDPGVMLRGAARSALLAQLPRAAEGAREVAARVIARTHALAEAAR